jgi:hypothetical protein
MFGTNFTSIQCCSCGCHFGLDEYMYKRRLEDKKDFYCPNGHPQSYTESEADQLRKERDRLKQQIAYKDDLVKAAERQVVAAKGQITKLKKRAKAGVCPCCNRTFSNMAAHMKTKHPDMDPNVIDLGAEKAKRVS